MGRPTLLVPPYRKSETSGLKTLGLLLAQLPSPELATGVSYTSSSPQSNSNTAAKRINLSDEAAVRLTARIHLDSVNAAEIGAVARAVQTAIEHSRQQPSAAPAVFPAPKGSFLLDDNYALAAVKKQGLPAAAQPQQPFFQPHYQCAPQAFQTPVNQMNPSAGPSYYQASPFVPQPSYQAVAPQYTTTPSFQAQSSGGLSADQSQIFRPCGSDPAAQNRICNVRQHPNFRKTQDYTNEELEQLGMKKGLITNDADLAACRSGDYHSNMRLWLQNPDVLREFESLPDRISEETYLKYKEDVDRKVAQLNGRTYPENAAGEDEVTDGDVDQGDEDDEANIRFYFG